MQHNGWTRVVMVMAAMLSTSAKGEQQTLNPIEDDFLLPSESHQVSVVVKDDLQASATGYGGYGGGSSYEGYGGGSSSKGIRGYGGSHSNEEGVGGHRRHHADKGHKGSHYGDHGKAQYSRRSQGSGFAPWYPVAAVDHGSALPPITGTGAAAPQH
ncbi:guanyl-specific ribonuclease pgl-1-like [Penaeus monodon]|uniref:guanyl-specific ribonuclease pgl-1-like n=1 Tax=Penaeus monodon TaxID=6687 RepID=UPI0018A7A827|nr:guanyl-specific ribonuclease pgl-1-like [Penaeus monodon]